MINVQEIGKLATLGLIFTGSVAAATVVTREFLDTKTYEDACIYASNNIGSNNPFKKAAGVIQNVALCTAPIIVGTGTLGLLMGGTHTYGKAVGEVARTVAKIVK